MNAFLFGSADHRLFGIHQPSLRPGSRSGVVLCYPWGQEYLWAHRSFRTLASLLATAGHHVLRFDYHGTGDSGGDLNEGIAPSWHEDIATAIDELKDMVDPEKITLLGLRMGAAWAVKVAAERNEVARLVAWDPIFDGAAYVRSLEEAGARDGADYDVFGFTLTPAMRSELGGVTRALYDRTPKATLVLETSGEAVAWQQDGSSGMGGLPVQTLHRIVEWLA